MINLHLLNRPEKLNSLTIEMLDELIAEIKGNSETRVLIIKGEGGNFSSGADLKGEFLKIFEKIAYLYQLLQTTPKIIIAAIDGYCIAGGFGLAAACDLVIATPEAKFQLPETRRGLTAPLASAVGYHLLPKRLLMELVLTGEPLPAARLYEAGFINHIVPQEELLDKAYEMANAILKGSPQATSLTKEMLSQTKNGYEEAIMWQKKAFLTGEPEEGMKAFAEKRPPSWL